MGIISWVKNLLFLFLIFEWYNFFYIFNNLLNELSFSLYFYKYYRFLTNIIYYFFVSSDKPPPLGSDKPPYASLPIGGVRLN